MCSKNSKEIEKLIANYFEGIFHGDMAKLESCFHENAYLYGDIKGIDYMKSIQEYLRNVKERQSPNDLKEPLKMEIIGMEIMGKIAMAKVHVPMLGYNYYDYLSLIHANGKWKIVSKIFAHVD